MACTEARRKQADEVARRGVKRAAGFRLPAWLTIARVSGLPRGRLFRLYRRDLEYGRPKIGVLGKILRLPGNHQRVGTANPMKDVAVVPGQSGCSIFGAIL